MKRSDIRIVLSFMVSSIVYVACCPNSVVVKISESNVIGLNERNGILDHAGRIEYDAILGNLIDDRVVVPSQQRLVGQEIHEVLKDAAGWRAL